ncbi:hypothetical protein P8452_19675 [Trifolium repens]|nr:hypothetical protein P8452_19675 [Trifolium repens]
MNALEFALMGSQRRKPVVSGEVKKRIVFHEAGHAIVAVHSSISLLSATIVPRECHLGVVCQESHADETRQQLLARLDVYMGGRYAEEISFGSTSVTSSESDLFLATSLATAMVTRYGMSFKLGPVSHIVDSGRSSKTQVTIEEEVKKMLEQAYKNANAIVDKHRKKLDLLAHALMEHETLSETQIIEYAGVRSG